MHAQAVIEHFVEHLLKQPQWQPADRHYLINQLCCILSIASPAALSNLPRVSRESTALEIATALASVKEHPLWSQEQLVALLMNLWVGTPSAVNLLFLQHYRHDPSAATAWFYALSRQSGYIKLEQLALNRHFTVSTEYGELEITINAVKPEKDPKVIAQAALSIGDSESYPKCVLCRENEGLLGGGGRPVRIEHRVIGLDVLNERWFMQFSPYLYYNEHAIFISEEHRPMVINQQTFERLLALVEQFPHYFIGANADLPIVGGSILSHDHYQGGAHTFALQQAPVRKEVHFVGHDEVKAGIVAWPMAVIRLKAKKRDPLVALATHILQSWQGYSDNEAQIVAFAADGSRHQTLTPIAYYREGDCYLELVLRNNRTSSQHPDGIFHPHSYVHHIKKENIGLIEVMGLAILPGRLQSALADIKRYLLGKEVQLPLEHRVWVSELASSVYFTVDNVDRELELALARRYLEVLHHAGVFKDNPMGMRAFLRFIDACNGR